MIHIIYYSIFSNMFFMLLLSSCFSDEPSHDQNIKRSNADNNEQSNISHGMEKSHFNSDNLLITDESKKMKILTKCKKLLLDEKYEEIIVLLPDLEKELVENYDKEESLMILSSMITFPLTVLEKEAEAIKKLDEIIKKYSSENLIYPVFLARIVILCRLSRTDEVITECQKRLKTENVLAWRFLTLWYLIQAYLVKHDYNNAKDNIVKVNEFFLNPDFWKVSGEIKMSGEIKAIELLSKFYSFFLEHLCDSPFEMRYNNIPPVRPIVAPYDKSKVYCGLKVYAVLFSKNDGCVLSEYDLGEYLKKYGKKEVYDQFKKELEDLNKPPEDPFLKQLELEKK